MERGGQGGEGPGAFDGSGDLEGLRRDPEDGAEGQEPAVAVGDDGSVDPGEGLQDGRVDLGEPSAPDDVVERPLGQPGREVVGVLGVVDGDFLVDPVGRRDQLGDRGGGVAEDDEEGPLAVLAQVEPGLEDLRGQVDAGRVPDGLAPGGELGRNVQEPPAGVAEGERQAAPGKDLDLLRGGQNQADVAAVRGSPGRGRDRPSGRGSPGATPLGSGRPNSRDVDGPAEVAVAVDDVDGPDAVAEPVEPLDRRQADAVLGRPLGVGPAGQGRVVVGAQQEGAGGDPAVLVGRKRRDPQRLQRRGDSDRPRPGRGIPRR